MAKKFDHCARVRNIETGKFISVSEAKASPETAIFEEKKNGKVKLFRPRAAHTGEFVIGGYMMLEPVSAKAIAKT